MNMTAGLIKSEHDSRIDTGRCVTPGHSINVYTPADPGRERVERYIASIFEEAYGARVSEYLPLMCSLERDMEFSAALGLRSATKGSLFCETYLDAPLESHVLHEFGTYGSRSHLIELGNLVASQPGQAVFLYLLVVAALGEAGVRFLAFTANRAVRLSIRRCGFTTRVLRNADSSLLGDHARVWGSYYDSSPVVALADIRQAVAHGKEHPVISELWTRESLSIESLADAIREFA